MAKTAPSYSPAPPVGVSGSIPAQVRNSVPFTYASAKDLAARYGETLDQIVGVDNSKRGLVRGALEDATAEVDSYLQGRFLLPLPFVPPVITQIAADIAIYRLLVLRPNQTIEDARARYEDAIKRLQALREGKLDLGLPKADSPAICGNVQITSNHRLFSRQSLRDA
jgi:phage gp36-like protein